MRRTLCCLGLTATLLPTLTTPLLAANRELSLEWLRNQAGRFDGPAAGDLAGRALAAAGDVNGDGHDDFLVGAYDTDFLDPAGRAYLVYGTAHGLPQTATLGADVTFTGNQAADRTGSSVAGAGDVNGDGFDDVLIGAPRWDAAGGGFDAGRAYLVYGGPNLPANVVLATLAPGEGVFLQGSVSGDLVAESVAGPGDVNGDGRPDLLLGAPGADGQAGRAYIVYGGSGLPDVIDLASLGAAGVRIDGAVAGDVTGRGVTAAGDVNGDGFRDVAVAAINADPPGKSNGGRVSIIYGGAALPTSLDLAALGAAGVQVLGEGPGDFIGKGLAGGGDVNGDGFDDLLIGSPDYDGAGTNEGRAWLVYGGAALSASIDLAVLGAGGVVLSGAAAQDNAGNAVAMGGDTNRDGYADFAVAAHNADPGGNSSGAVYLVHGGPALAAQMDLGALGPRAEQFSGFQPGVRVGDVAAFLGDVDDDGFADLGLASRFADDGGADAGAAWVVKGGCRWLVAEGSLAEGDDFVLRALGTPNDQWLNYLSPFVLPAPFESGKGPFWLGNPFIGLGVLSFDANGEANLPLQVPTGMGLSGLSAYWQFIQTPQGNGCDLSRLLITTVE